MKTLGRNLHGKPYSTRRYYGINSDGPKSANVPLKIDGVSFIEALENGLLPQVMAFLLTEDLFTDAELQSLSKINNDQPILNNRCLNRDPGPTADGASKESSSYSYFDPSIRIRPSDGATALHIAAAKNHPSLMKLLYEGGATALELKDEYGRTPLYVAAADGSVDVISLLIQLGARVDTICSEQDPPRTPISAIGKPPADAGDTGRFLSAKLINSEDRGRGLVWAGRRFPAALLAILTSMPGRAAYTVVDEKAGRPIDFKPTLRPEVMYEAQAALAQLCREKDSHHFAALFFIEQLGVDPNRCTQPPTEGNGMDSDTYSVTIPGSTNTEQLPLALALRAGKGIDFIKALVSAGADPTLLPAQVRGGKGVKPEIRQFLEQYIRTTNQTAKQKLTYTDYSNRGALKNKKELLLIAYFIFGPTLVSWIAAWVSTFSGLLSIFLFAFSGSHVFLATSIAMAQRARSILAPAYISGTLVFCYFVCLNILLNEHKSVRGDVFTYTMVVLLTIVSLLVLIFLLVATFKDPGCVQSTAASRQKFYNELAKVGNPNDKIITERFDISVLCVKPMRSKHCSKTNACVRRFDHFCVWTGNAIGGGNHRPFIWFVILFAIFSVIAWFNFLDRYLYIIPELCALTHIDESLSSIGNAIANGCQIVPGTGLAMMREIGTQPSLFGKIAYYFAGSRMESLLFFYGIFINGFVAFFLAAMLYTQFTFAARNMTSNETWFSERYRWLIRISMPDSRETVVINSFNLRGKAWLANIWGLLWADNLLVDDTEVPKASEALHKEIRQYTEKIRSFQAKEIEKVKNSPAPRPQEASHAETVSLAERAANKLAALPADKLREMQLSQQLFSLLLSKRDTLEMAADGLPVVPPEFFLSPEDAEKFPIDRLRQHGFNMLKLFQRNLQLMQQGQAGPMSPLSPQAASDCKAGAARPLAKEFSGDGNGGGEEPQHSERELLLATSDVRKRV